MAIQLQAASLLEAIDLDISCCICNYLPAIMRGLFVVCFIYFGSYLLLSIFHISDKFCIPLVINRCTEECRHKMCTVFSASEARTFPVFKHSLMTLVIKSVHYYYYVSIYTPCALPPCYGGKQ